MNIIDAIGKNIPHKDMDTSKCYKCGKESYPGFVMCRACIADVILFSPDFVDVVMGTDFTNNFNIDDWKDILSERIEYHLTR